MNVICEEMVFHIVKAEDLHQCDLLGVCACVCVSVMADGASVSD